MRCFLFFLVGISIYLESNSQSAICNYSYRKRITIDHTKVGASTSTVNLSNFPTLIKITTDNDLRTVSNSGHVESTNGFDIVFTASDGVTLLSFQMESYTATNGQYTAWVLIPTLYTSVNTFIYMYYGNSSIVTNQSSTSVFNDYHATYHFESNSFNDNSPSGYTLTNQATANQSPAFIGDGRLLTGTEYCDLPTAFPNITSNFSMSGWIYTTSNGSTGQRIFCDDQNNTGGYAFSLGDPGAGRLRFYSRNSNPVSLDIPANTIANNTWYYVVAVADITNLRKSIFINGTLTASGAFVNAWGTDNGTSSIGGENAGGETANRFRGRLDEIRVAKTALSADWILTEYNSQSSPSTFYTISVEPKVWTGGSSANYNTASNWLNNAPPGAGDDVIINNGTNQPTLQGNEQVAGLWIKTGATLSLSNLTLSFRYDITNCGTISGNTGLVNCNSTGAYAQNQYLSGSGVYNINDITVNNTYTLDPSVTLQKDVNVSGALLLTSGIVYTAPTFILALSNTASSSSGSAISFVSGPISKTGSTSFVFPVGKGIKWRRCALTGITASDTYTAQYFNTAFTNTTPVNSPLNNVSLIEYWQCDRAGSGNAFLTLYWEDASSSGINNCADLTIARWNGASWDERLSTAGGLCAGTGAGSVVTNALITAFSPFTFGSRLNSLNPLPVTLLSFTATPQQEMVLVHWTTATEKNNDYFVVQRSLNGVDFEDIGTVKGKGNSNINQEYFLTDKKPYSKISYYRLKQIDVNLEEMNSPMVSVDMSNKNYLLNKLFPNPNSGLFSIYGNLSEYAEIIIYNSIGKIIDYSINSKTLNQININCNNLSVGIYNVVIKDGGIHSAYRLIIN